MAVRVPTQPKPIADSTVYSRLPARSLYMRAIIEQHNHMYGMRGRTLVPLQMWTAARELRVLSSLHAEFGDFRVIRSEVGRALVILLSMMVRTKVGKFQVVAYPTFSEWDGTTDASTPTEVTTDAILIPGGDGDDPLNLNDPHLIAMLERPRLAVLGDEAQAAYASWRYLPAAAISVETMIKMRFRALSPPGSIAAGYVTGITIFEEPLPVV